MTPLEAKAQFFNYLDGRKNRAPSTLVTYNKILTVFFTFIDIQDVSQLTVEDIDRYADYIYAQGCVAKTRRNRLSCIRSFIAFLYIKDLIDIKPEKVELPEVKHLEANYLTTEEARVFMLQVKDLRDRALLLTLLTTWTRINECLDITLDDIYKQSIIIRNGKGGGPRVVFINDETERALRAYLRVRGSTPGPLFLNRYGVRLSRQSTGKLIKEYALRAGIYKRISCHTLRHTGATGFLESGGSIEEAQTILGHANIHTTRLYLHFTNERLHASYNKATRPDKYSEPIIHTSA